MRTNKNDNNSFNPYRRNEVVEDVVEKSIFNYWQAKLDKALDERIHLSNPVEFQKIADCYLEAKKSLDKIL